MHGSGGGGGPQWPNPAVPLACEGATLVPLPYITAEEVAVKAFVARAAEEAQTADADPVRAMLQYVDADAQEAALLALEGASPSAAAPSDLRHPSGEVGGRSTVHTALDTASLRRHLTSVQLNPHPANRSSQLGDTSSFPSRVLVPWWRRPHTATGCTRAFAPRDGPPLPLAADRL
jgi:hypothetical protein